MIHKFVEHEAAQGNMIGKLERLTIFEYERERLINDNSFEELYPRSDATMARYQGHLALLEPSPEALSMEEMPARSTPRVVVLRPI